jgi:uncharacterized protein
VGGLRKDIQMLDSDTLASRGFVVAPGLIDPAECRALAALWPEKPRFRSHVVMQRHGFGQGEYQYFAYPLPERIEALRQALYPALAAVANRWNEELGVAKRFPPTLQGWLRQCHAGGQKRPTPLLLRYGPGDYNCLHRDLYGELVFPLQVTVLLSDPGRDFSGGEFMLVEQRPRMQSRGEVVPLSQGDAVVFAVNERPVKGSRGFHRTAMRHGVSSLRDGERFTLGIIFHDAA